jgi:hypothetical protein
VNEVCVEESIVFYAGEMENKTLFLIVCFFFISFPSTEVWEQDLGDAFKIDESTEGLQKVNLKCGGDSMHVELLTDEDFTGVMYTRGSYYKQSEPCFVKPKPGRQTRQLEMKFSMNQCQTVKEGDVYSNVVVVQHDPELVTPGDAAFVVECDFRQPRSLNVGADFQASDR